MKPSIEQIIKILYDKMPITRRETVLECASAINALYDSDLIIEEKEVELIPKERFAFPHKIYTSDYYDPNSGSFLH